MCSDHVRARRDDMETDETAACGDELPMFSAQHGGGGEAGNSGRPGDDKRMEELGEHREAGGCGGVEGQDAAGASPGGGLPLLETQDMDVDEQRNGAHKGTVDAGLIGSDVAKRVSTAPGERAGGPGGEEVRNGHGGKNVLGGKDGAIEGDVGVCSSSATGGPGEMAVEEEACGGMSSDEALRLLHEAVRICTCLLVEIEADVLRHCYRGAVVRACVRACVCRWQCARREKVEASLLSAFADEEALRSRLLCLGRLLVRKKKIPV